MYSKLNFVFISTLLIFILISSCKKEEDIETLNEIYSHVDSQLVGDNIKDLDLGIQFCPPAEWELNKPEYSDKTEWRLRSDIPDADKYVYKPDYVFYHASTKSIMRIGSVSIYDTLVSDTRRLSAYVKVLDKKYSNEQVKKDNFTKDGIPITHYEIIKPNIFSYELVFLNRKNQLIKFDYTFQAGVLNEVKKSIESSIGSIKLL